MRLAAVAVRVVGSRNQTDGQQWTRIRCCRRTRAAAQGRASVPRPSRTAGPLPGVAATCFTTRRRGETSARRSAGGGDELTEDLEHAHLQRARLHAISGTPSYASSRRRLDLKKQPDARGARLGVVGETTSDLRVYWQRLAVRTADAPALLVNCTETVLTPLGTAYGKDSVNVPPKRIEAASVK